MKKTFLSLGILSVLSFAATAQDATTTSSEGSGSEFKPSAGNITFEVNALSPFSAGGARPFELNNGLRFRYFLSEKMAFRLNLSIAKDGFNRTYNNTNTSSNTPPPPALGGSSTTVADKYVVKSSAFEISIMPGVEFHKGISERLSVYYGAYIDFTMNSKKASIEATPGSTTTTAAGIATTTSPWSGSFKEEVKGGWYGSTAPADVTFNSNTTGPNALTFTGVTRQPNTGFTRIGLVGVIGADYYITKGLYLGLEAGWGFSSVSNKAVEVTRSGNVGAGTSSASPAPVQTTSYSTKDDGKNGAKQFIITPMVNAAFRLGFWF